MRRKNTIGAAMAVALLMSVSVTQAGMVSPSLLYYSNAFGTEQNMVDDVLITTENTDSYAVMRDEVDPTGATDPVTGYVIFDMGSVMDLTGFSLIGRDNYGNCNPENVDFFYFAGTPSDPGSSANITFESGSNYTLIENVIFTSLSKADDDVAGASGESSAVVWDTPVTTQYVGMKVNSSYGAKNAQFAEIDFLTGNWVSPAGIVEFSGTEAGSFPVSNIIDEDTNTSCVVYDDTTGDDYVSCHIIFDLGETKTIDAAMLAARDLSLAISAGPSSVDFFYFEDNDPSNNSLLDNIEGDSDITLIANHTFSTINNGNGEVADWSGNPITTRYIGMRINDSYQENATTGVSNHFQLAEITFSEVVTAVPEPSSIALLLGAIAGLMTMRCVKK